MTGSPGLASFSCLRTAAAPRHQALSPPPSRYVRGKPGPSGARSISAVRRRSGMRAVRWGAVWSTAPDSRRDTLRLARRVVSSPSQVPRHHDADSTDRPAPRRPVHLAFHIGSRGGHRGPSELRKPGLHRWTHGVWRGMMKPMNAPDYVRHEGLKRWVAEMADCVRPDQVVWCDGSEEEYDRLCQELVDAGTFIRSNEREAPEQLPRPLRSERRRARRGPHVHLLARRGGRRPDQQLGRPRRDDATRCGTVRRLDARPHDVRDPVQHGAARLADRPDRRRDHRLALRRRQHADHDPHGSRLRSTCSAATATSCPCLHSVGAPLAPGRDRRAVAVQPGRQVHRPLPRDPRDLVVRLGLRRQRAARQEVPRAAHRVDDGARRGLARRAHADPGRHEPGGREDVRRRRVPERLRQDELRDAHPAGGVLRQGWKVTTVGDDIAWIKPGDDGKLYAINPEAGYFGVAPGHLVRHEPDGDGVDQARTRSSPTSRSPTTATSGGRAWTATRRRTRSTGSGNDWTPESDAKASHPERPLHGAGQPEPGARPRLGRPERRPDPRRSSSAVVGRARSRSSCRASTGPTACTWPRRWAPRRRPPRSASRASCAATRSRCCRSPATTWAATSTTGWRSGATSTTRRASSR